MKLSVIAPTFNEAENVRPLVDRLERALQGINYEILIVDDDSPDLTWSVAGQLSARDPRVRVLRRNHNPGLGAAVIDGFTAAEGDVVACIDADLQHDPGILPAMLEELDGGAEVVVGSRYVPGGGTRNWNLLRRAGSHLATQMARIFLGVSLDDPMSGYFLMRRRDFCQIRQKLNGRGFKILLEIVGQMRPERMSEVPYVFGPRLAGKSKLSAAVASQYLAQLWRLSDRRRLQLQPVLKFFLVGGLGVLVNLLALAGLVRLSGWRDWRVSMLASLVANLHNYILNNAWTFRDRLRQGLRLVTGYASYLLLCSLGLAVTAVVYHLLSKLSSLPLLLSQLAAIILGTYSNYHLNRLITWRKTPGAKTAPGGFRLRPLFPGAGAIFPRPPAPAGTPLAHSRSAGNIADSA